MSLAGGPGTVDPSILISPLASLRRDEDGRGDRIRTCDPLLPKQMRYQAALLPDFAKASSGKPAEASYSAGFPTEAPQGAAAGGPGRIRTCNLAVMSGRLYR